VELARIRLRGIYAAAAGVMLALAIPYLQGTLLFSQGYADAVSPISAHHDFAPLVAWIAAHSGADRAMRLIELVPYLFLITVPPSLVKVLWNDGDRMGWIARLSGQVGFALYLVAGILGLFTSASAAASFAGAHDAAGRAAAASGFATGYAVETLLSRVLGGAMLTLFLVLVSVAVARVRALPSWMVYAGLLVAALQGATALFFALGPGQSSTPTSSIAYYSLAAWLVAVGYYLFRMVEVEDVTNAPPAGDESAKMA
jgi:hypothetical protein